MEYVSLILSVIALIIAILAYQKVGGLGELRKQIDQIASSAELKKSIESVAAATESIKEKTAEAIGKLEATLKRPSKEERPPAKVEKPPKRTPRKRKTTRRRTRPVKTEGSS